MENLLACPIHPHISAEFPLTVFLLMCHPGLSIS